MIRRILEAIESYKGYEEGDLLGVSVDWLIENVALNNDDAVFDILSHQDIWLRYDGRGMSDITDEDRAEVKLGDIWDHLEESTRDLVTSVWGRTS